MCRLIIIFTFFFASCLNSADTRAKLVLRRLSSNQIIEMIEAVKVCSKGDNEFHVFYKEYLNDSTWVLRILQNDALGNEELGVCEVIKLKGRTIFVYDYGRCHEKLDENLESALMPFRPDGIAFHLLVERRRGRLKYYELKEPFKFDDSPAAKEDSDEFFRPQ